MNFSLNGHQVQYDANGDPPMSFVVIHWHPESSSQVFEVIGTYDTYPEIAFTINNSLIQWDDGAVSETLIHCFIHHIMFLYLS